MGCRSCQTAVSVRPTCGGKAVCVSPWVLIFAALVFILVLFVRCQRTTPCQTEGQYVVVDVNVTEGEENGG